MRFIVGLEPDIDLEPRGGSFEVSDPRLGAYMAEAEAGRGPMLACAVDLIEMFKNSPGDEEHRLFEALLGLDEPEIDMVRLERRD
jgi:hypothetical protein